MALGARLARKVEAVDRVISVALGRLTFGSLASSGLRVQAPGS